MKMEIVDNSCSTSPVKSENVSQPLELIRRDIITLYILSLSLAFTIAIVGEDVVELNESSNTLTLQLTVTGVSFGVVPLRVIPVSYSQYEELRSTFSLNSTLSDIVGGRAIPLESALPGNHGHLRYIIVEH